MDAYNKSIIGHRQYSKPNNQSIYCVVAAGSILLLVVVVTGGSGAVVVGTGADTGKFGMVVVLVGF